MAKINPAIEYATRYHKALSELVNDCGYDADKDISLITDPERIEGITGSSAPTAIVVQNIGSLNLAGSDIVSFDGYWMDLKVELDESLARSGFDLYSSSVACFYDLSTSH